ncbi:MAG: lamin tail domain-containing protein [Bacteroidota bacterium]
MKLFLPLFLVLLAAFTASAQTPTDLFFSEYVEGSGNNKALEIYNPTSQTIDMTNYWVLRFSNGSSTFAEGGACHLTGTIAPYKTFILANGQTTSTSSSPACSPILQAMANQLDGVYPAPTYMNGNDAIALVKTPGGAAPSADMSNVTPVDLFGEIGLGAAISAETGWSNVKDTTVSYKNNTTGLTVTGKVVNYIVKAKATDGSTFGPFWLSWTSDHTLIRKPNVTKGVLTSPSPFVVTMEWDTAAATVDSLGHLVYKDIWTNLGTHECRVTGINEIPAGSWLTIYPNPVVSDHLSISSKLPVKEVEIFSVIGQSVLKQVYTKGLQQVEISGIDLVKGMYLVKVTSVSKATSVQKILVK